MQKTNTIEISTGTIVKSVLFVLLLVGLYFIRDIVGVVLFSIVIASAIEPAAGWFEKKRVPRIIGVLFVYLIMFMILGGIFYMVVPTFFSEISGFAVALPRYLESPTLFNTLPDVVSFSGNSAVILQELLLNLREQIAVFTGGFFKATATIFGGAMSFFLIIILSFYLSVQKNGLENFLRIITPIKYENYILGLWSRSRKKIGGWMQGQILLGILVGVLVYLGLSILRVEYALSFALLAAVFELIPIFGPIMAAIPPVAVAFLQNPTSALMVAGLFIIIQQFENHLIYPLVVRKIVGIPPIFVILSIIIGAKLGGLFGILLAIPAATVLMEFLNDLAAKKHAVVKQ